MLEIRNELLSIALHQRTIGDDVGILKSTRFPLKKGSCGVCRYIYRLFERFSLIQGVCRLASRYLLADLCGFHSELTEWNVRVVFTLESINQMQMMSSRTIKFSSASREENAEFHKPAAPTRNCSLMIENRERLITPREVIESQIKNADIKADRVRCDSAMEPRPFCV